MSRRILSMGASLLLLAGCAEQNRTAPRPLPNPVFSTGKTHAQPGITRLIPPDLPPPPPPVQPRLPIPAQPRSSGSVVIPWGELKPNVPVRKGRWDVIVVHHSASDVDSVAGMDRYHRKVKGWKGGLGYHFVIGNGVNSEDGRVYAGPRWKSQSTGAHCATSAGRFFGESRPGRFFNEHGIGVCLIGNFEKSPPSPRQLDALRQLIARLCDENDISPSRIYGHGEVTGATICPGKALRRELVGIRQQVAGGLARIGRLDPLARVELWLDRQVATLSHGELDLSLFSANLVAEFHDAANTVSVDGLDDVSSVQPCMACAVSVAERDDRDAVGVIDEAYTTP